MIDEAPSLAAGSLWTAKRHSLSRARAAQLQEIPVRINIVQADRAEVDAKCGRLLLHQRYDLVKRREAPLLERRLRLIGNRFAATLFRGHR